MGKDRLFEPSWIDRFNNRVEKMSIRFWIFYASFGLILIAVQVFILWLEGGSHYSHSLPFLQIAESNTFFVRPSTPHASSGNHRRPNRYHTTKVLFKK